MLAGGASIVSFNMSEDDIETLMRQPWTMGSSDGGLVVPGPASRIRATTARCPPARRATSASAAVLTLEHAIATMTSLPAQVFGFSGRGEIRAGAFADVVDLRSREGAGPGDLPEPHQMPKASTG